MPRPRKCRMVGFLPENPCFHPQIHNKDEIVLSIEEVESIRLSDYLGMEQDSAAENMNVSRGTFQRIINAARKKTADALVHGKTIRIDGGHYELSAGKACCRRHNGNCKRKGCEKCEGCEENR
ncbi:MAG: putative DNA-binding protein [Clostridiales bacterium]|nr:putative DNA-binding protein [Clostridiales bacterium]